jgi:hypothetical protein
MPDALVYVLGFANWALTSVTLLKGRGWIALAGALLSAIPSAGLVAALLVNGYGAARLALPASHWAQARYTPAERDRARALHPDASTEPKDRYPILVLLIAVAYGLAVATSV